MGEWTLIAEMRPNDAGTLDDAIVGWGSSTPNPIGQQGISPHRRTSATGLASGTKQRTAVHGRGRCFERTRVQ